MYKELNPDTFTEVLRGVIDPVAKEDIISTGKVRYFEINGRSIRMDLEVLSPALHIKRKAENNVREALHAAFGDDLEIHINLQVSVPDKRKENAGLLPGVKNILAISSGKGGVGKSTVSANLAVTLARQGFRVGLIDADIYGPSVPMMFDVENRRPNLVTVDGQKLIEPVESMGVKLLSIGFFADVAQAVVWRGPMASKALRQMFADAHWGELDFLLIDLPPGTGDIHLTLVQTVPVTGALVVSTPQKVALADAEKGANMFRLPAVNVPVLGMVENMAYFTPDELPDNKYYIFGKDGVKRLCEKMDVPFLGEIPLVQGIREGGDSGKPLALDSTHPVSKAFADLADSLLEQVVRRNEQTPPTQVSDVTRF
ncbi:MAG: Mrp/NBP35 family ATP-binding protein [Bacteroidia bacterium]|nr:Mrp/NBP35 family ATP-binding protein [Bacteroidia bacterium]